MLEGKTLREKEEEKQRSWQEMPVEEHMEFYLEQGMERKEAMRQVAKDRGCTKREIYQYLVKKREE